MTVGQLSDSCRTVRRLSDCEGARAPSQLSDSCRTLSDTVGLLSDCRIVGRFSTPFSSEAGLTIQFKGTLLMKMVGDFAI